MGKLEYHKLKVPYLTNEERIIRVYLPTDYDDSKKKYPVLYMHDGQNIFVDSDSFSGTSWNVKETMEKLEAEGNSGIIVVGIDNGGDKRIYEYSPLGLENGQYSFDDKLALGEKYLDFLTNDVKKFIENTYRVKTGRKNAYLLGSSLGAVITLTAAVSHKGDFSKYGIFSPATSLYGDKINKIWEDYSARGHQFYFYVGTEEGYGVENYKEVSRNYLDDATNSLKLVLDNGVSGKDVEFHIGYESIHDEKSWSYAFPNFIKFLSEEK